MRKGGVTRRQKQTGRLYGHAGVPDLIALFQQFTRRIIFTHFGTWFIKNVAAGTKKIKAMEADGFFFDVAEDGKIYTL
jgi:hypothetical protein